jgi:uncharacterized protein
LLHAISNNDLKLVKLLIDNKADTEVQDKRGLTAIGLAIMSKKMDRKILDYLLDKGKANINFSTPKMDSGFSYYCKVKMYDAKLIEYLLSKKADPCQIGIGGYNCLHNFLFYNSDVHVVKLLLDHKADINQRINTLQTALHIYLCYSDHPDFEMVKFLVQNKADLNALDENGHPPIFNCSKFFFF